MVSPVSEATDPCGSCGNDLRAKARFCDVCGAKVEGNSDGCSELATRYLELCERLDARGLIAEARRMVG